jgi:ribosomal protein S18 acetylase RimI-like enzyme
MPSVVVPLLVRDLVTADLPDCRWAGSGLHLRNIAGQLERARAGEVDYLAACPPSGTPVAIGGVDYLKAPDAGTLWQLSVHPALQSCGIGTVLIHAAEQRIITRRLHLAELSVERDNTRARSLYERLGYTAVGTSHESWIEEQQDGTIVVHEAECALMRKGLP